MAAIIYWVPILFPIALAAFSRGQSRVRVEYSMARAFTGCAAVVAAGRTRADGGGARQADRGRRESCVFYADFASYLSHWVDAAALMNKGIAAVCQVRDTGCVRSLENLAARRAPARRVEVELTPCCLRLSGGPIFVIAIMPPR
jgi:hypothetical protein